jgi:hypothetical protein
MESTIATNEADFCNVNALCHVELMGQFSTTRAGIPFLRLGFWGFDFGALISGLSLWGFIARLHSLYSLTRLPLALPRIGI